MRYTALMRVCAGKKYNTTPVLCDHRVEVSPTLITTRMRNPHGRVLGLACLPAEAHVMFWNIILFFPTARAAPKCDVRHIRPAGNTRNATWKTLLLAAVLWTFACHEATDEQRAPTGAPHAPSPLLDTKHMEDGEARVAAPNVLLALHFR